MKFMLISDNHDTLTGMRLAGIEGVEAHSREEVIIAVKQAQSDPDVGIILITQQLVSVAKDFINERKLGSKGALFLEIPDRHGRGRDSDAINEYIRDAIGISI